MTSGDFFSFCLTFLSHRLSTWRARHLVSVSGYRVLRLNREGTVQKPTDLEGHRVVELVGERVGLGVVNLVRVELLRPFPLLGMPTLVQDSRAS